MTVVTGDILRATAEMSWGTGALQNVFHLQLTTALPVPDATALNDMSTVLDNWFQTIDQEMAATVSFDQVRVQNVTQGTLLGSIGWQTLVAGVSLVDDLPRQSACLVNFPTAVPKTRGSVYLGGFTETNNDAAGAIAPALLASAANFVAALLSPSPVGANIYQYIVLNRLLGTVIPAVSGVVQGVWRTQRRRRIGVGI